MAFLRECLDDPQAAPCGRCDTCTEPRFSAQVSAPALAAAQSFLGRAGLTIEPRKMWPSGLKAAGVSLTGKIGPSEQALPGRAVGRLTDLGWGGRLRTMLAEDAPDGPAPADLLAAVVEVLKGWAHGDDAWPARPAGLVTISSRRRPELIASVAEHVARVGRLPLLGTVQRRGGQAGPGSVGRANSAQRVLALHGSYHMPSELAEQLAGLDGPVLLVDDLVDSGWTMALVARELRAAGAPAVLPLALGTAS
jgi:ATP-dependent DNA helicase RecQ